jgi:hypothetical protein
MGAKWRGRSPHPVKNLPAFSQSGFRTHINPPALVLPGLAGLLSYDNLYDNPVEKVLKLWVLPETSITRKPHKYWLLTLTDVN